MLSRKITALAALVALLGNLAALLLVGILLFQLRSFEQEQQLRLQELGQSLKASRLSELLQNFPEVPGRSFLLPGVLGLLVVASLALVALAFAARPSGGSRGHEHRARREGSVLGSESESLNLSPLPPPPLEDGRWMKLVEECVEMFDELDRHMDDFDAPRREVAKHVVLRLEEILGRSGVEVISDDTTFDRARHKPVAASAATTPGTSISETLSPGFAVGRRVLQRARVRLE